MPAHPPFSKLFKLLLGVFYVAPVESFSMNKGVGGISDGSSTSLSALKDAPLKGEI